MVISNLVLNFLGQQDKLKTFFAQAFIYITIYVTIVGLLKDTIMNGFSSSSLRQ